MRGFKKYAFMQCSIKSESYKQNDRLTSFCNNTIVDIVFIINELNTCTKQYIFINC